MTPTAIVEALDVGEESRARLAMGAKGLACQEFALQV